MNKGIVWCLVFSVMLFAVGATAQPYDFTIRFRHKVGNSILQLFDSTYTNQFGEPFVVNKFKYYLSDIVINGVNNKQAFCKSCHYLVDETDSSSKVIGLYSSKEKIASIEFTIGVDSIKNFSGVQTGVLDPINGMFWTWNSGYVFAKLEGTSDSSHAPLNTFGFHVGGYKANENAARKIKLNLNSNLSEIKEIVIDVDILKWFNAKHPLSIAKEPICHQPGKFAMQLADNYSSMFSIAEVK